jgi:hypothetical protein
MTIPWALLGRTTTTADPYGMTNKRTDNGNGNGNGNGECDGKCEMRGFFPFDMPGSE